MLRARVAGSAGPDQTGDTDPIIGLGGDGDSIHSKAPPLPLPSPATRVGTWGRCAGSVAHDLLTSEEAASVRITARLPAAWWWCQMGGSGQREDGRAGGSSGGLRGARAPCGAWGVSWAHLSPGGGQGESKGQSQGGQANPKRSPGGQGAGEGGRRHVAVVCGPSQPNPPQQALPASLARGRLTFN